MENKVSIIVPIYKVEQFLDRCVQSLLHQTYENLEIILIDDGSPDRCPQMCDAYAQLDPRIRVIHKKNNGLSKARNSGLDAATGDFVLFVDADDYIERNTCEILVSAITDDVDFVSFGFRRFFNENEMPPKSTGRVEKVTGPELFHYYLNRTWFTHMVCDKMFRRSLFDGLYFIENRLAEDLAICHHLVGRAKGAIHIDRYFYNYYTRSDSIMGSGSLKLCVDAYQGECEAYRYWQERCPQYSHANDVRFLNQSMKAYLKLKYMHQLPADHAQPRLVAENIRGIPKSNMPLSTLGFFAAFSVSKKLAWWLFKLCKLT